MSIEHDHSTLVVNATGVVLSGVLGATWIGWLPPLLSLTASAFAIVWYAIQIWESRTVRRWRGLPHDGGPPHGPTANL